MIRLPLTALLLASALIPLNAGAQDDVPQVKFARYRLEDGSIHYGVVEGELVRQIEGSIFEQWSKTDTTHPLEGLRLLPPKRPYNVIALAGNYKSHLDDEEIPAKFQIPQPFFKSPSSLIGHDARIVIPKDAREVHYEAEMVLVIGKRARRVPKEKAMDYVLGVTCGNDVSERYWQNDEENKDVQWWRAKGADTFGPCGPFIVTGLNPDDLLLQLRLNGQVVQSERTSQMIHDVATQISFITEHITLVPGDLIFTGTPGKTEALHAGDIVEVELEGVGTLRNKVYRRRQ